MERHHHHTVISSSSSPPSPAPTTFVQADTNTFRELVQKLTGLTSSDIEKLPVTHYSRPSSKPSIRVDPTAPRRGPFKLQERRHTSRKLEIKLGLPPPRSSLSSVHGGHFSPRSSLSSVHGGHFSRRQNHRVESSFPSPVTPLGSEYTFFPSSGSASPSSPALSEEEKAIAEKGFYLHPSPLSTPRGSSLPELLTLFPTSPSQRTRD